MANNLLCRARVPGVVSLHMVRRARPVVLALLLALVMLASQVAPTAAVMLPSRPTGVPNPPERDTSNTQIVLSGLGPGRGVNGFIADPTNPFDPVLDGYPPSNPTTGFTPNDEGFAGVIYGAPTDGGPTMSLYCFDILTSTWPGVGYVLGTWDAATVPNVGYVARILSEYYPFVPDQPSALAGNPTEMAAAVQAAIWFFSDRYVLSTSDPNHDIVAGIVAHIIAAGPLAAPTPPTLSISPTNASGPSTGAVVGPFTVMSGSGSATVRAAGANMFSDAAGTVPIADGSTVPSGTQIWLRSTGTTSAVLLATAVATVPQQNVYLYDGNAGVSDAQKLILAQDATLTTTVSATAEFKAVGSLTVQKTIAGPAAGRQAQVTIHTVCDNTPLIPDFVIASGTPAGTTSRTYTSIPAGSICTITETVDGQTSTVLVNVSGDGQQVTIPTNSSVTATVTDTYDFVPGSLTVVKNITGPGAGLQGAVTIHVDCGGGLTHDFVIPAGTPAGSTSGTLDDIPAGSTCTVSETAFGTNSEVTVTVTGGGPVTVPAAGASQSELTDDYALNPGSLVVKKTIAGAAASLQDQVTISVECDGTPLTPDFVIPAETAAGTVTSPPYTGIPAGSICTATEAPDGSTSTVAAEVTGDNGTPITITPGGQETAAITDTYTDISGQLIVNKIITGNGADLHGPITITVSCPGVPANLTPDFTIPAGAPSTSKTYTGLPPDVACTLAESVNGAISGIVDVTTTITQPLPVSSTGSVEADVTDDYVALVGSLTVTKTIAGPAAGQQGAVTIGVFCNGVPLSQTPPIVIPANAPAGPTSQIFTGIPDGTKCIVFEIADGRTSTVSVTVTGRVQSTTVTAGATATVAVTDTYSPSSGTIIVPKLLAGPFAGQQGPITIAATCNGALLPSIVIPAGTPAGLQTPAFNNVPPGSSCTITETADGATSTVTVTVLPTNTQTVTVAGGAVVVVPFINIFADTPGTLTVTKNISGSGAGQQGPVSLLVDCGEPAYQFAFLVPAGTPAGSVSRSFDNIPAGSTCTITETSTGQTSTVTAAVAGSGQQVTIAAGATATVQVTDTFTATAPVAPITNVTVPVTA